MKTFNYRRERANWRFTRKLNRLKASFGNDRAGKAQTRKFSLVIYAFCWKRKFYENPLQTLFAILRTVPGDVHLVLLKHISGLVCLGVSSSFEKLFVELHQVCFSRRKEAEKFLKLTKNSYRGYVTEKHPSFLCHSVQLSISLTQFQPTRIIKNNTEHDCLEYIMIYFVNRDVVE